MAEQHQAPLSRRGLLAMIGTAAGSSAMYQAMTTLGLAAGSTYKGPIRLEGDPASTSVRCPTLRQSRRVRGEICLSAGRAARFGLTVPSSAASIAPCRCWARFAVAQAVQRRDPGLKATGVWRMSG